ncbi:DUF4367 domain-containing protein [Blautia sp. MSJ-19]|uniref:DUF4367 domain-containing protein n=1 Tax=Blautia sp. MSJ-19 TaxID=2841517 RepID=UPI001C0EB081|nr:DUF4367 domain-containing protein [Blautia sp. MSJ-19]MBU5482455.1 DUF4367 domain-containing protein [Blautia sp. MSJ-19]
MKKMFENEQKDKEIEEILNMPDMDDDEKFCQWLEEEFYSEADIIEESLLKGRRYEDNLDTVEELKVSRDSFYQRLREEGLLEADDARTADVREESEVAEVTETETDKDTDSESAAESEGEVATGKEMLSEEDTRETTVERERSIPTDTVSEVESGHGKVVAMEKKTSAKKKWHVRLGKVAGIAGVCLLSIFMVSMSSEANRNHFIEGIRYLAGDDTRVVVDNDKTNEQADTDEYEAIQDIEDTLGVEVPEFFYRPNGMEFFKYEVSMSTSSAWMEYTYEGKSIVLFIDNQNADTASNINGISGSKIEIDRMLVENIEISINEIGEEGDTSPTYAAGWTYGDVAYQFIGKIELQKLEEILKQIKF